MADQVQFTADGSQVFDVISRLQSQLGSLESRFNNTGKGSEKIGEGFLRSERIVGRSSANIVTGLLQANNAAEALANALLQVEHSTKLGLGIAVGAAVGIAILEALVKQISAVKKAEEELNRVSSKPLGLIGQLDPASIDKQIEAERAKLEAFEKITGNFAGNGEESQSGFGSRFKQGIVDVATHGIAKFDEADEQRTSKIAQEQARIRREGELRLAAESAIVAAQETGLHVSATEGELLKARAATAAKIAQLSLDARDKPNPVLSQEIALEREKLKLTEETIQKKAFHAQGELIRQEDLANFRGTAGERTDKTLQSNLADAVKQRDFFAQNLQEKEQANLDVAKAQLAIYERQKEIKKEISDLHFATKVDAIKSGAAQAAVGAGPEEAERINLEAQVRVADELRLKAAQRASEEHLSAKSMQEFNAASSQAAIAQANLSKFEKDRAFTNKQELDKAKTENQVTALKDQGRNSEANILKIREQTESKIAQHLRDQKGELAQQDKIAGQLALKEAFNQALRDPFGDQAKERAAAAENARNQQLAQYYQEQKSRGVKFDDSDPIAKIVKNYLAAKAQLDKTVTGKENQKDDFSSVASLAGKDFSSLADLGDADFSGLAALAKLQITIK